VLARPFAAAVLLGLGAGSAFAAIRKGSYEASDGVLEVTEALPDRFVFRLQTVSGSGDVCDLDGGSARRTSPGVGVFDDAQGCRLEFSAVGLDGVSVKPSGDCATYCGASADLAGEFRRRPPLCAPAALAVARKRFARFYAEKNFREAAPGLERRLDDCGFFIPRDELSAGRGDVVLAWLGAGEKTRCLAEIAKAREENPALAPSNLANLSRYPAFERVEQLSKALSLDEKKCADLPAR
jgi:hypothetical protein